MQRIHATFALLSLAFLASSKAQEEEARFSSDDVRRVEIGTFERVERCGGMVTSSRVTALVPYGMEPSPLLHRIEEGTPVKQGDVVAELDREASEANYRKARVELSTAESELVLAEATLEHRRMAAETGRLELELEREELEVALLEVEDELERLRALISAGRGDPDEGERALRHAEHSLRLAKGRLQLWSARERAAQAELSSEVIRAEAELRAARDRIEWQRFMVEDAERGLESCRVVAPHDGIFVLALPGSPPREVMTLGSLSDGATPIGWVVSSADRLVTFELPVAERSGVSVGQRAEIRRMSLPGPAWSAELVALSPFVRRDSARNFVYEGKLRLGDDSDELVPGLGVIVSIVVERIEEAILLPVECLDVSTGRNTCRVRVGEQRVEERELEIGSTNRDFVVIREGLRPGEVVLVRQR